MRYEVEYYKHGETKKEIVEATTTQEARLFTKKNFGVAIIRSIKKVGQIEKRS